MKGPDTTAKEKTCKLPVLHNIQFKLNMTKIVSSIDREV